MINTQDLIRIARERLIDAKTLLQADRYDSAVYLCGYFIEIALKYKICQTLNWPGSPSTNKEFEKYKSLKTHDLGVLLRFAGLELTLLETHTAEWSDIITWNPEGRYTLAGMIGQEDAIRMINSTQKLIEIL